MPEGTTHLAVLFADICDSVRFYERVGDAMGHRVAEQIMARLSELTEANGGAIIRTQGDGVMCVFPGADSAYDAALAMQEAQRGQEVAIKVALSFGEVIESKGEVYGDTVHLAARLLDLARAGEILMPGTTLPGLSTNRRQRTHLLDTVRVKGKAQPVSVYKATAATKDREGGFTTLLPLPAAPDARPLGLLRLKFQGREWLLEADAPTLTIGRAEDCDLVIANQVASRRHALIRRKSRHFELTDQSTNGTYLRDDRGDVMFLKRESVPLLGSGTIGFGEQPAEAEGWILEYCCEAET